jgi:sec-independent protein translocase protein TatC
MSFWDHIEELRRRLKWSFVTVLILFAFFGFFEARVAFVGGIAVPYPWPNPIRPFASQFFSAAVLYVKPSYVELVVLSPSEGFIAQIKTAFFLAVVVGSPVISHQFFQFMAPGLYEAERRAIMRLVVPSVLLFLWGVLLAFFVVVPFALAFLYQVAAGLGARPFLQVDEFLDFVILFLLGFGGAFQLPVVMYALTASGLVRAAMWRKYWRFAILGIFVFGAVITPDGSGVTMLLVSLPMTFLYVAGWAVSVLRERRVNRESS